jgi:Resolvase, N terminal domain
VAEAGISGASRHNRPGLLGLMARIDEWDVLVAYDFARLGRNEEDLRWIRNRLRIRRRQAFEASTGLDLDNVGARVMNVMNAEYLEKVRKDTLRGLRGRSDVALGRLALGGLLGENWVRVYADGRIEGLATLSPETLAAPRVAPGAARLGGSGGRICTARTAPAAALRVRLPWAA